MILVEMGCNAGDRRPGLAQSGRPRAYIYGTRPQQSSLKPAEEEGHTSWLSGRERHGAGNRCGDRASDTRIAGADPAGARRSIKAVIRDLQRHQTHLKHSLNNPLSNDTNINHNGPRARQESASVTLFLSHPPTTNTSHSSRPRETVKLLYDYELRNAPGKSIVALEVSFPPDGWTPPHTHAGATVVAVVTEGTVLSGMNGNPPRVYAVGENFMELPGCHHTVGENNSKEVPAKMVATMVVDTEVIKGGQYQNLVVLDAGWE